MAVALYHLRCSSFLTTNSFIANADLMVDFFFVLSGFVIAYNYLDRITSTSSLIQFQKKRFWRLYPLHIVTLLVFLGIESAKFAVEKKSGITAAFPAFSVSDGSAFLQQIFLMHAIVDDGKSFNYPSWSISTEFYTYLLFGLVTLWCVNRKLPAYLTMLALAVTVQNFGDILGIPGHDSPIWGCILGFFLGVVTCYMIRNSTLSRPGMTILSSGLLVACIAAVSWTPQGWFRESGIPILFAILIASLYLSPRHSKFWQSLSSPPLVFLGKISYSIYMIHAAFWWVSSQFLRFVLKIPTETIPGEGTRLAMNELSAILYAVLGLAAIVALSALTYKVIENPWRHGPPCLKRNLQQ